MARLKRTAIVGLFLVVAFGSLSPGATAHGGSSVHGEPPSVLYRTLCSNCHGIDGDGNGPFGRFLTPLPRDFGTLQFKLISTDNGIASKEDLFNTITRGMPGTAMPGFNALTDEERWNLAEEVGVLAHQRWAVLHPDASPQDLDRMVIPGKSPDVGAPPPPVSDDLLRQGNTLYHANCVSCHGKTGTGNGPLAIDLEDQRGDPVRPRNFVQEPMKGGAEQRSLYHRIRYGMPGSPMPAFPLVEDDLWALVYFLRSSFMGRTDND